MSDYDLFDFAREMKKTPPPAEMRQALLGFLCAKNPTCAALNVPLKRRRLPVTCASFRAKRSVRKKIDEIVLVQLFLHKEHIFGRCDNPEELRAKVAALAEEKLRMEKFIELTEPELADNEGLFPDFRIFDYANSKNREYHKLCRRLSAMQDALHYGSLPEKIRAENAADLCYIAAPEGVLDVEELPPGWGFLQIDGDLHVRELKTPERFETDDNARLFFAHNIAGKAMESVMFAHGLRREGQRIRFSRPPRKRKIIR